MPLRKYDNGGNYRYGFNGKEKVDEIYGEGNAYDFGARIYDNRLGKWLSLDPLMKKYPGWSPYNYVINNPLNVIDPDGKEIIFIVRNKDGSIKEQLKYMKGNFWHADGKRYDPGKESLSPTMFKLLTAYRLIENSKDEILKGQLHQLEGSKKKHYMQEVPAGQGSSVQRYNAEVVPANQPSGSNTGLDFSEAASKNFKEETGVPNSVLSTVTHEMRHQLDHDLGNNADNTEADNNTDPSEIRAVYNENRARKIENLPARKSYGGKGVIDPKKLKNPPNNVQPKKIKKP